MVLPLLDLSRRPNSHHPSVTRGTPARTHARTRPAAAQPLPRVTNPERVIDPTTGFTKIDLVRYYSLVASLMLARMYPILWLVMTLSIK
jgi:hypothetical protein